MKPFQLSWFVPELCRTSLGRGVGIIIVIACLVSCTPAQVPGQAQAPRSPTPDPVNALIRVETFARGLEHPWGLAFLPDGRMLVTERPGRLRIVEQNGRVLQPLVGVPEVQAGGQGGLLD